MAEEQGDEPVPHGVRWQIFDGARNAGGHDPCCSEEGIGRRTLRLDLQIGAPTGRIEWVCKGGDEHMEERAESVTATGSFVCVD
jgi:hypothetical protein